MRNSDSSKDICALYDALIQCDVDEISEKFDKFYYDDNCKNVVVYTIDVINNKNCSIDIKAEDFDKMMYLLNVYAWLNAYIKCYNIPVFIKIEKGIVLDKEDVMQDLILVKLVIYKNN